jgi:hypothetical protein
MQHMATITGNQEILKSVGLLDGHEKDYYMLVADKTLQLIKDEVENTTDLTLAVNSKILLDIFAKDSKAIRSIVKRPAITKAYAAKDITVYKYVQQAALECGIHIPYRVLNTFTKHLIMAINDVLVNELKLMKMLQDMVGKYKEIITWKMSPISDFIVLIDNKITKVFETKFSKLLPSGNKIKLHTTYKVVLGMQNIMKNKNSIFVNLIHSMDALHIAIILKEMNTIPTLPIHDALLLEMTTDLNIISKLMTTHLRIQLFGDEFHRDIISMN